MDKKAQCTCASKPWNPLQPFAHLDDCPRSPSAEDRTHVADDSARAEFLAALDVFVHAALEVDRLWPNDGLCDEDYPEYLPSFDEFVSDLSEWGYQVRERAGKKRR